MDREYQVDGSDTTATGDRDPQLLGELVNSPLYAIESWLRDESSYSRWEHLQIHDLSTGASTFEGPLPEEFRIDVDLRRPESAARLWLLSADGNREGLELDRDRRNARWLVQRQGVTEPLPRWFFPEQPAPFAAELLNLLGRSVAAGYVLVLMALGLAAAARALTSCATSAPPPLQPAAPGSRSPRGVATLAGWPVGLPADHAKASSPVLLRGRWGEFILAAWLLAASLITVRLYHQLPHILDAISYTYQAGLFASGRLTQLPLDPALLAAFRGPFEVLQRGSLFSQYPPGAPAAYALGKLIGLEWLVGSLAGLALIAATSWTASALHGRACGLVVLVLGALSPFILFQAGSFLSHPIAGGVLACALAAYVRGEQTRHQLWFALCGALLGFAAITREAASVLFALPLAVRTIQTRNVSAALTAIVYGLPFVALYLVYNQALTGSPWVLPRSLFDASDHFGFGDGIGFHLRHTLAAGLVNTDEQLTLLQFDLFGWPPLVALGLLAVPFLFGRWDPWDALAALGVLGFVVAYVGYFYSGISLGPRYYFEAVPWLLLLAGRGVQVLAQVARSRTMAAVVLGLLGLYSLLVYLPLEIQRRTDFSALPGGRTVSLGFVSTSLLGPRVEGVAAPALVLTNDWWLFNAALSPLNCPQLPNCDVLFAFAATPADEQQLRAAFPDRESYVTVDNDGRITLAKTGSARSTMSSFAVSEMRK
jgi:hypothetical protein